MISSTSCGVQWRPGQWRVRVRVRGSVEVSMRPAKVAGSAAAGGNGAGEVVARGERSR